MGNPSHPRWAVLVLTTLAGLLANPVTAGELRVVLDAEAGARSDGNYAQAENLEREQVKKDESIARSGFHLRLSYELPRMVLALGYSPSYEWVLGNTQINGTTHRLDLGLAGNLTRRLKLNVRERLVSSPSLDLLDLNTPFDQPETFAVTRRGDQLSHALDVSLAQEITRRTSVLLGAAHTLRTFEAEDLADTETLGARFGLGFQVTPDRRLEIQGTSGTYDFGDGAGTGLRQLGRNGEADVRTLGLGWSQAFLRDGRFRIEGGVFSVDSARFESIPAPEAGEEAGEPFQEVRVEENHTGWRGALELSRRLERFDWNLGYRHDVSAGAGFGRAVQVDNAFAGVSTRFGRVLVLGLDVNGSRHRDLSDDEVIDRARLVEALAGTFRFNWRFSQVAALNGGTSYIKQDSQVEPFEDLSYSRYFLGLALQLYRSGEEPRDPADAGVTDDDEPDTQ